MPTSADNHHFPVVLIGASAGGLKAIETILQHLPENTGMAFIIIQHLSRKYKSLMKEILEKITNIPVEAAQDGLFIQPNHIYLNPPAYEMRLDHYTIHLQKQDEAQIPNYVIDTCLHAAGKSLQEKAIGIILSGTGSDGSRGIRTIKEYGGLVMVQAPESGEFDGMPRSAIETKLPDFILSPKEITQHLIHLAELFVNGAFEIDQLADSLSSINQENYLNGILFLIQQHHSIDFSGYKESTILRRIHKMMAIHQIDSLKEFHHFLQQDTQRITELYQDILIGVTEFFRDPLAFQALETFIFPQLINETSNGSELRIWVCACSTGEEAYSLAIALNEYAERHGLWTKFKILATDIDEKALQIASRASYTEDSIKHIPLDLQLKYFTKEDDVFEVKKFIRDMILFARNDATKDPPFINLDFISCRNLLIYLKPETQKKLLLHFHFGLKQAAYLWLGINESAQPLESNFQSLSDKFQFYLSRGETPNFRKSYEISDHKGERPFTGSYLERPAHKNRYPQRGTSIWADYLLQEKFNPGLIFDLSFRIHFIFGKGGTYLSIPGMELNNYLLDMVSREMVLIIRNAVIKLEKAPKSERILYKSIQVHDQAPTRKDVRIEVIPSLRSQADTYFLLEFLEEKFTIQQPSKEQVELQINDHESLLIIEDLQKELRFSQFEAQRISEELESSSEELQASNEELIASNEELQSTNEELQSVNEELYTVNSELQRRNQELSGANTIIDNLLNSTEIETLFLDKDLVIRFFTPTLYQLLPLQESDIGRPLKQLTLPFSYVELERDANIVIRDEVLLEREVRGDNNKWYLIRLTPYRNRDMEVDGLVIAFVDVTERKLTEQENERTKLQLGTIIDAIPGYLFMTDLDGNIVYANKQFEKANKRQILGKHYGAIVSVEDLSKIQKLIQELLGGSPEKQAELLFRLLNQEEILVEIRLSLIENKEGNPHQVLFIARDIQAEKEAQAILEEQIITFRHFMEKSPQPAWIKNADFQYLYANGAFLKLIKQDTNAIKGANDFGLFPELEARMIRTSDEKVLSSGKAIQTTERYSFPNKSYEYALVIKFPLKIGKEKNLIAGYAVDITSIKEMEEGVKTANKLLEEKVHERTEALLDANKELRTFTRSIAHDLRNPIRSVTSYSQIILEQHASELGADVNKYLGNILRQSKRMAQLVESLLSFAKLGTKAVRKQQFSLNILVEEVYEELEVLREGKVFEKKFQKVPDLYADIELMQQVMSNLLSNAIKYSLSKDTPIIEFGSFQKKGNFNVIYFIKDNGIGFETKYSQKVFEVFERLHPNHSHEGSGIGLSIVKRAIELQNGSVWVESSLGQGTTFFFSLPADPPKAKQYEKTQL